MQGFKGGAISLTPPPTDLFRDMNRLEGPETGPYCIVRYGGRESTIKYKLKNQMLHS